MRKLSLPLWVSIASLLWIMGAAASVAWGADQKPLVINQTTGKQEQMQAGNALLIPGTTGSVLKSGAASDTTSIIGQGSLGFAGSGSAGYFYVANTGAYTGTMYALAQGPSGDTFFNCATGQTLNFNVANGNRLTMNATLNLFNSTNTSRFANTTASTTPITGSVIIGDGSTTATNVGIGAGAINAGANITQVGSTLTVQGTSAAVTATVQTRITRSGHTSGSNSFAASNAGNTDSGVFGQQGSVDSGVAWITADSTYMYGPTRARIGAGTINATRYFEMNNATATFGSGVSVVISGTTASTSKDTGVLVLEGGVGVEGTISAGGNIVASVAGGGFSVKEGSNAKMGLATLSGGTVVVNTTAVTVNSRIQLTAQSLGTVVVPSALGVSARTAATSFTILSSAPTDTSTVAWIIVEPAP